MAHEPISPLAFFSLVCRFRAPLTWDSVPRTLPHQAYGLLAHCLPDKEQAPVSTLAQAHIRVSGQDGTKHQSAHHCPLAPCRERGNPSPWRLKLPRDSRRTGAAIASPSRRRTSPALASGSPRTSPPPCRTDFSARSSTSTQPRWVIGVSLWQHSPQAMTRRWNPQVGLSGTEPSSTADCTGARIAAASMVSAASFLLLFAFWYWRCTYSSVFNCASCT